MATQVPFFSKPSLPVAVPAAAGEYAVDSSGRLVYYNATLGRVVIADDPVETNTFSMASTLQVKTGTSRWYLDAPCTWVSGRAGVGTAPTGASVILDVKKNGSTIYTTSGNRPTIAISGFTQASTAPDITTFSAGDYITVDVAQVGSTIVGADLTYTLRLRRT